MKKLKLCFISHSIIFLYPYPIRNRLSHTHLPLTLVLALPPASISTLDPATMTKVFEKLGFGPKPQPPNKDYHDDFMQYEIYSGLFDEEPFVYCSTQSSRVDRVYQLRRKSVDRVDQFRRKSLDRVNKISDKVSMVTGKYNSHRV